MQTVRNRVADILGIDLPIVQAPMNYIAGHALAAAVSAAGVTTTAILSWDSVFSAPTPARCRAKKSPCASARCVSSRAFEK